MTNTTIKNIINTYNTNKNIRWSVAKNTDTEITLTNSYDKCVNYTIKVKHQDGDEWIVARDNHMDCRVAMLLQGDDKWSDYKSTDEGIELAISKVVGHFNYCY